MPLISIRELTIGFRGPSLLDAVSCQIEPGQRIGLLGRNGSGKTTFMRILCGDVEPDGGQVTFAAGTRVALLPQDVPKDIHGSIAGVIAQGVSSVADLKSLPEDADHDAAWRAHHRVERVLTRME